MKDFHTAELSDIQNFENEVFVCDPVFRDYGGIETFCGRATTAKVHEDNVMVRRILEDDETTSKEGKVLVVDGGGSLRCALLGDKLAELAVNNHWSGIIILGCIRDSEAISRLKIGVKALATHPKKSGKNGWGEKNNAITIAGVTIRSGNYIYADRDGILVARSPIV